MCRLWESFKKWWWSHELEGLYSVTSLIYLTLFVVVVGGLMLAFYLLAASPTNVHAETRVRALCKAFSVGFPPPDTRLVIRLENRTAELYSGNTLLKTYPLQHAIHTSLNPIDGSPLPYPLVGTYTICRKAVSGKYHRVLMVSFPSPADAERAFKQGLIERHDYDKILRAHREGNCPPINTPLGGAVLIHGKSVSREPHDRRRIEAFLLSNADIEELFIALKVGDPVVIVP